ncbi:MAG: PD40 domain-containing protein [Gemmatimonadota bacterium]|nr:MAG: PD40 domain-containing protein [Gemmatimonadota bacterium]
MRRTLVVAALASVTAAPMLRAQYFGQNKVQHHHLDFSVIQTQHFDVYYYDGVRDAAIDGARLAERAYGRLSQLLNHRYRQRQPLVLYASHSEFQQNNVTTIGEGTAGVTEPLRHRILVPFTGSYAEFQHVLQHEIVHQFQFDVFAHGVIGAGLHRLVAVDPPLWFMEGMAEYLSLGPTDPQTAMWLRDDLINDELPTIAQLTSDPRFTPYRYGHSLWSFIGERWGDAVIARLLHSASVSGVESAFQRVLGVSLPELSYEWHAAVRSSYESQLDGRQPVMSFAEPVLSKQRSSGTIHISPVISPDGSEIAYLSEGSWYWIDLYLADANTGRVKRRLVKSAFSSDFESLRFLNSAAAWSPDGRLLAFAAKHGGSDDLVLYDVERKRVVNRIKVPLDALTTPTWSSDGSQLAFTGYDGGFSDLFLVNSDGTELRRLTNDKFADLHPAWSPDGQTIAFATDRGAATNLSQLSIGPLQIATYDIATGRIEVLPGMNGQNTNPQWAPHGGSLAFVSDRSGIYNVFLHDFNSSNVYQLTDVATGTAGITPLSPAISWAARADRLVFTCFEDGEFNVYGITEPESLKREPYRAGGSRTMAEGAAAPGDYATSHSSLQLLDLAQAPDGSAASNGAAGRRDKGGHLAGSLAQASLYRTEQGFRPSDHSPSGSENRSDPPSLTVRRMLDSTIVSLPDASEFTFKDYKPSLQVDYAIQPTIGYVRDNFGGGLFGGSAVSFSDMLGNRRLLLAGMVNGRIDEAQVLATYANLGHRINWAVGVSQNPIFFYRGSDFGSGPEGTETFTVRYERMVMREAFLEAYRPFSRFRRLELTMRAVNVSHAAVEIVQIFDPASGAVIDAERRDQPLDNAFYLQPSLALVFDNAASIWVGPFLGRRNRVEYAPALGNWNFHQILADFRRYDHLVGPFSFASRLLFFGRFGADADKFPVFLGRTDLLRGYTSGSFRRGECAASGSGSVRGCGAWDQLTGSRIALASGELRFPLPRVLRSSLPIPPIETALFFDAGLAWDSRSELVWKRNEVQQRDPAHFRSPLMSWGFSLRTNLMGFFILRADFARPLTRSAQGFYWVLSFGPTF